MKPTLTNPTDDQLNAAFAEHVAGFKHGGMNIGGDPNNTFGWSMTGPGSKDPAAPLHEKLSFWWTSDLPKFTRSMDAVLPWLKKAGLWECGYSAHHDGYWVTVSYGHDSEDKSLPRAAVIALLRANGVEVVFK
jgi:hypothetical protein